MRTRKRRVRRTGSAPGWETEAGVRSPHQGNCLGQRCSIWGFWSLKQIWDSLNGITHSILAAAMHTPDRDTSALESSVAGSWRIEIGEQSQASSAVDWRDGPRGPEGGNSSGKCLWRKARQTRRQGDSTESHTGGGARTLVSLSPHVSTWELKDPREGGPLSTWRAKQ